MSRLKTSPGKRAPGRTTREAAVREVAAAGAPAPPPVPEAEGTTALVFEVGDQRFGLPVEHVVQIVEMVAITPLPRAPEIVAGVIDFHGQVIPVVDVRTRLDLPAQRYSLRTPIIISRLREQIAGLIVDRVSGVIEVHPAQVAEPHEIFTPETRPALPLLEGVARTGDGLLLILNLATFLSREEVKTLKRALTEQRRSPNL